MERKIKKMLSEILHKSRVLEKIKKNISVNCNLYEMAGVQAHNLTEKKWK
jgi:hypothetical protein